MKRNRYDHLWLLGAMAVSTIIVVFALSWAVGAVLG